MQQMNTDENHPLSDIALLTLLLTNNAMLFALKSENSNLRDIIELLPGNVYWKDREGKILGCNKNMSQIAKFQSSEDIIGKDMLELFGKSYATDEVDEKVIRSGQELSFEENGLDMNNQPAIYLSRKLPLHNATGEIIGTAGISFDITDRKRMEEELKIAKESAETAHRIKSQFIAAVNHELRTPLASIIGLIDLLSAEKLHQDENQRVVASIKKSAQFLANMVNDVLDFSKLESGAYTLQIAPFNFQTLLADIHDMLYPLVKNRAVLLRMTVDPDMPDFLLGDAHVLQHILINLTNNAIKYTEEGEVAVHVQIIKKMRQKIQLKISVMDTGTGMPPDKLETIFEPFHQLNNNQGRNFSRNGTGLGLTIVKKLSDAMNGSLHVTSVPEQGSTFSLTIELKIPDEKKLALVRKDLPEPRKTITHQPTVLVIEDDPMIQYIHRKLLLNLGCIVDVVKDGSETMRVLNETHEIIFLDMSLPDMRGGELIKTIRETTPYTCPIVVVSAYVEKEEAKACLKTGAVEVVEKPVSQVQFQELLLKYCPDARLLEP